MKINENVEKLELPISREISSIVNKMEDGIDLTVGQPDIYPSNDIKQAMIEAIHDNKLYYAPNSGMLDLKLEIAKYYNQKYKINSISEKNVLITNGASGALDCVFRSILEHGDEVIVPTPCYSAYQSIIELNGGKIIPISTIDSNFKITVEKIKQTINNKTKAILLNYPTNPTGVTLNYEEMEKLVEYLYDKNIYIISDEIYNENLYEKNHTSFAQFSKVENKLIIVNGFSKAYSLTGNRIGYILSEKKMLQNFIKAQTYNSMCVNTISQVAAITAITKSENFLKENNEHYKKNRDYIYTKLIKMGFEVKKPEGAFYIFPKITNFSKNTTEFCRNLLLEEQLAVVPGNAFGDAGKDYIRISYACSFDKLQEACRRLERYISFYKEEIFVKS